MAGQAAGTSGPGHPATAAVTAVATAAAPAGQCLAVATVLWPREVAVAAANPNRGHPTSTACRPDGGLEGGLRWVLDPDDDLGCVRALLGLHDPTRGLVACLAAPRAPWAVLARDLLLALGKSRAGLAAAGSRARAPALLELWLRAEQIDHLVILRAHLLPPTTLRALEELGACTGIAVWTVAHGPAQDSTPLGAQAWPDVFSQLSASTETPGTTVTASAGQQYAAVRDLARRAARSWRLYTERTLVRPRHVRPGCGIGVLLQNLTIDAEHVDDLLLRLHALQVGFRDEGLQVTLPPLADDPRQLRYLGPRFGPDTVERLRRIACPVAAAALTLARATDNNAPWLAGTQVGWTDPDARHVRTYTGTFRIPPQVRPLLRAALLDRATRADPSGALFLARDGTELLGRRLARRIGAGAEVAGLYGGEAAIATNKGYTPASFATGITVDIRPRRPFP